MIDRGNGARASKAVSARAGREALLRKALLGSTALIGITLATPALAQSTSPAGGGTITGAGTYTDDTATNGGVMVDNTVSAGVTMTGVMIDNTTGNPNGSAYRQNAAGGQSAVLYTAGTNSLRSDQNGAALFLQAGGGNLTWAIGQTDTSSTTDLNATFGAYLVATGFINVVDFGTVSSLRNVTGINGDTGIYATSTTSTVNLSLKAPTISGFATGINALSATGATVTTTGGTISALPSGTGITASATGSGAGVTVSSGSAITTSVAGIGIKAASTSGSTSVTTTAGGTINGGSTGIQVNSARAGQTSIVTVGAAIGNSTRPSTGVVFDGVGVVGALNTVNANANISSGSGLYAIGSNYINTDLAVNVASGVTVSSQGSYAISAAHDITIVNNGTITATSGAGRGVANASAPSIISVTNNGVMSAGNIVIDALGTGNVTNSGTITATNYAAISTGRGGSITNNAGATITGGSDATGGWAINFASSTFSGGQVVTNNGTITGGGAGAIRLDATAASLFNLNAGSTTTGLIRITGTGAATTNLAGTLNGNYDASAASGTQSLKLAATGSMQGATLGTGNDTFTWGGGAFSGTIDGGAGTDTFAVDLGSSTNQTVNQSTLAITNFENYNLVSGNLTLTGNRSGGNGWTVAGGNATTFILNGALTNITGVGVTLTTPDLMFVQSGAQLSATGDVIYSSGNGNNIQNSGTIVSGAGLSSAVAIGSGTVDNYGLITYAGGVATTQGNGVLASSNQLSLSNHTGATLIGRWDGARANNGAYIVNDGLIQGDRFAGVEISGTSVVYNNATGRIYGATGEGSGLLINSGAVQVTNAGQIVGAGPGGINNIGSGLLSLTNTGTIGSGTLDGSNNFLAGGAGYGVFSASLALYNSGTISATLGGVRTTSAMTLTNVGTITTTGTGHGAVESGAGTATIRNSGTINAANYSGVLLQAGGTLTNAVGGTITGGNDAYFGAGVFTQGFGTINNYGTLTSSNNAGIVINGDSPTTINLFAGSSTGSISAGAGDETLAIYNGQVNASAVTQTITDPVTGATSTMTLQNAGTLAAATYGAINLGGGNDTIQLRGTGTGAQQGFFSLANANGVETITKLDGGTWALTGAAAVSGLVINANAGELQFQGTSGIGTINANGGTVLANGSGAFGTAVVHLLSSNVQFGAAGVYANNFVLDVPAVLNGQPAVFENLFGGNAILSGSITSGSGTNAAGQAIGSSQAVTFAGIGGSLFNLTGTGNSWTGITTINSGVTVRGSTAAISGGSITNNGTLTYAQSGASTSGTVISGTGALRVESGQVTLTGFNTYTGGTTVAGGTLQVGNGGYTGRITGAITVDSGGTLVFNRADNYDFTSAISGAGNVQALGTVSLSGAITNTGTFTADSATGGQVTLTGSRSGANSSAVTLAGAGNILRVGLSGSVAGGQFVGVRLGGTGDGVDNFGSITNTGTGGDSGYGAAIAVVATSGTSTINNGSASNSSATISGQNAGINHVGSGGIVATGLLTVNNYGLISGNLYNAIENQGGSGNLTVDNKASGRIVGQGNTGGGNGIGMGGAGALTLTNAGQIVGRTNGVATGGTVNINNSGTIASGTLSGGTSGVLLAGSGIGIQAAGGTISNQSGATISGSTGIVTTVALSLGNSGTITGTVNAGLNLSGTGNTITNWGTIAGGNDMVQGNGVRFLSTATGTLNNQSGALISGGVAGVYAANSNVSVDNGGTIVGTGTGSRGVYYQLGNAVVTNQADGVIVGQGWGIQASDTANINNAGFIGAGTLSGGTSGSFTATANGNGLVFNGGYLTNGSGATIIGGNYGVASGGSTAVNINNLGTITGGNYAIWLTGTNDDTVSLYAGSTTNGAIALGGGNDTLNWYGGSFTSIDGGNGSDRFAASISAPTTLDLSTITGFESHDLTGGGTLTLTGTQTPTDGGWRVTNSTLALGSTAKLEMTGTGVVLSDAGASLTVSAGGQLIAHDDYGVAAYAGGSVTNAGLIKSTGGFDGVITNGGTVDNQAGGRIIAAGNGVTLQAYGTTLTNAGVIAGQANGVMGSDDYQTLTNTGVIVAGTAGDNATAYWQTNANLSTGDGVRFTAGGSVTNVGGYVNGNTTGIIVGGANGVTISGGAATIENSGTLQGNSGYGISIDTAGGVTSTITNHNGGALVGGTGAALLSGDGTVNMTNETGSYMYGSIVSTGNGTRNVDLSGVVYGDYDASSGAGVDNVILRGGSIYNVNLGDGDDSFTYFGGTISGVVDGGAGNDKLFADFGAGQSYNVSLSNFTGFESLGLVSGNMTLSGTSSNPGQDIYAGVGGAPAGTITFDGTSDLTGDIYVNGGSIRANTAGAFGSGTIHMIDPTATFGASGTYTNNISLEVVTPSSSNPSTLNTDSGVVATLTGAITTGTGAGVDPSQDLVIGGQGTIVLTNTANSWLGTTTINSGATLQGASDTISGSAIVNNGTLNYLQAYGGTVAQDISGNGSVNVAGVAAGNTLTFAGTNALNGTFTVYDASNIAFSGATSTGNLQSVALAGAGSRLDVTATGSLTNSNAAGVYGATVGGYDANQSVYNLGAITSTGAGSATAVYFSGANALLDNSGSITGNRTIWVDGADVQLINRAGGTITGNSDFALYLTQSGTIDNSGTIQTLGIYPAVYVAGTAAITNNAGGLITSQGTVFAVYGAGSTLTNAGSITSSDDTAVYLAAGGTVTNSGTISAGASGVGVWTSAGGTITNQSGGSITGGYSGLYLDGAAAITVNLEAGSTTDRIFSGGNGTRTITIAGTLNGGYAGGTGDDAITLDTSATVNGMLDGGTAGNNTLTLVGTGAATLGDVMNITSATKSGSGTWTLGSSTDIATWTVTGGTLVTNGGAIADTASVALDGGTLQLTGNEAIGIVTGNSNVALGTSSLALTSGTGSFTGNFNGTTGGLLIDGANFTFGGQANYTGLTEIRSGTLTLATGAQFNALSTLLVDAAGTLDLGTAQIAVGAARLDGTLAGTGTLAAHDIELNGATVNGNLAGNLLTQASGTSHVAGTIDMNVLVSGGTLQLAAANRIADAATVQVNSGATLDLQAFDDTIGTLVLSGTLAGSGTLTAGQYQLSGGTVNANLGAGTLFNVSGNSVLNGTAAGDVAVQAGTLTLGAADRLADTATVSVSSGATLDIGGFNETVGALGLNGTLAGTGTLTAAEYQLSGATVDANLGAGTVINLGGNSVLNGTAAGGIVVQSGALLLNGTAAGNVAVQAGTLALGAANRLADTATVVVASGATLDVGGFNETVGALGLNGTLAGTGTLTAGEYQLTGATVNANLGAGTLFNLGGSSVLNGTAAGNVSVQAGTLSLGAANRLADTATVAVASGATLDIGSFSDTIGTLGLNGTLAGTGTLTAGEYQLTGATVNANLGAGTVFNLGGNSVLNGTAAGNVSVQAGTLSLGAANRLADTATVAVASGATLNIGSFNDTIGTLGLNGTLAGTGTLTAGQYQLTAATVNANLGAGTLFNLGGSSVLNGTAAGDVSVQAGTLSLGAANRLADTATVAVASGATLNIGGYNDTVGVLALNGTLAGTGTLTASQYQLNNATVNANLGAGTLFNLGGTSTLNGTTGGGVLVQAGTLVLGGSNRIVDTATLAVSSGATFDLGANNETVSLAGLGGTLAGTGTLTAAEVQLNGATVNANIGVGSVYNLTGTSTLNGTVGAGIVTVQAGTLRLGANERLANNANLGVASGAVFDLAGYTETIGALAGSGTLALGTGKLVLANSSEQSFGGAITGSGVFEKQGLGRLNLAGSFANTGRFDVTAGTLAFAGSTQGGIRVQGGSLIGSGTLAGTLTIASGTFSPGGLAGTMGSTNPIGSWTVGSLVATGGSLLFDFGGTSFNFASDSIKVNGTATLSGGTVAVNALTSTASDYRFNQLYTIVQANSLSGTFANGSTFATVASNPNLKWRLRYDLVANAVVLQVQKNMEFNDGVAAGDTNTLAVANALSNSTIGNASDEWAATLNTITALNTAQRVAAFKSFSGEALANISTATISANNLFTGLLRQRIGDGSDALVGGGFAGASLADVRTTTTAGNSFASALSGATLPGTGAGEDTGHGGIWGQVYGGYQKLLADGVHAGVDNTTAGVAMGVETKLDGFTLGVAGGVAQIDSDMNSRGSTVSGNQYQLGGYASYDAGSLFVAASGSWYSGDFDSKRTLSLGTATSLATGDISSKGYSFGLTGGFRTELGNGLRLALIGSASKVHDKRDSFTERATGGLGLQVASASRDLFTASGELRLGAQVKTGAGVAMPWVSAGVRYNSGDLDTLGAMRFAGAPTGTGSFGVAGTRIAPVLGTLGVGIDARASKNVRLGVALEGSAGENTREGRASVRVKIGF